MYFNYYQGHGAVSQPSQERLGCSGCDKLSISWARSTEKCEVSLSGSGRRMVGLLRIACATKLSS